MRLLVPLLVSSVLLAAEAVPSAADWKPVADALDQGSPQAEPLLTGLMGRYPAWPDGWRELARLHLDAGKGPQALDSIRKAVALTPKDPDLRTIELRALAAAGKFDEAYRLVETSAGLDPKGHLRFEAGLVAAQQGQSGKATAFLAEAKLRCGPQVPPEFLALEARIAVLDNDLPRAETLLVTATTQKPSFWDGWYELGRIRLARAEMDPVAAEELRKGADEAFLKAVKGDITDADARIALGRTRVEQARALQLAGETDRAAGRLRDALQPLEEARALTPNNAASAALLGEATLRLGRHAEAADHLARARSLGALDRGAVFNLATALSALGKTDEADALLATVTVDAPAEQLTVGLNAYDGGNDTLALRLLSAAAPALPGPELQAGAWRFAGHAATRLAAKATDPNERLDQAAAAYLAAAELGDSQARRAYVAVQSNRSPRHAYDAGWAQLRWNAYLSGPGWGLVMGHYGGAISGGTGLAGAWSRAPLHVVTWGVLSLLPIVLGLFLALRRRPGATAVPPTLVKPPSGVRPRSATSSLTPAPGVRPRSPDASATRTPASMLTPQVRPRRSVAPAMPTPPPVASGAGETMMPSPFLAPNDQDDALEKRR